MAKPGWLAWVTSDLEAVFPATLGVGEIDAQPAPASANVRTASEAIRRPSWFPLPQS
jgi:hypothetical protein